MKKCSLCGKKQKIGSGSFFRVPHDDRRVKWSKICCIDFSPTAVICMDHFEATAMMKAGKQLMLLQNAVPIMQNKEDLNTIQFGPNITHKFDLMQQNDPKATSSVKPPMLASAVHSNQVWGDVFDPSLPLSMEQDTVHINKILTDHQTQTDPVILDYTVDRQNYLDKVRHLETQIKDLKLELAKAKAVVDSMRHFLTGGQIKKLGSVGNKVRWEWLDISSAICLHASGPRAYNHLYNKKFPLPSVATLQRWCRKVNMGEGILTTSIDLMGQNTDLNTEDKVCVLAFDEMKVPETFEYDEAADTVRKPANYVQVVMARELRKSWKQPIFYSYDCKMTVELLKSIIIELQKVGFPVVAIVCDMGPTNRKLWKELDVSAEKPWFCNPHNIRNHFIVSGFIFNDKLITARTILELMSLTSTGHTLITFKLSNEHLSVTGVGRQKVKLATQLFSNTTANAIRRCYSLGMELYNAMDTAEFVQLVNDWFDVQNSSLSTFTYPGKGTIWDCVRKAANNFEKNEHINDLFYCAQQKTIGLSKGHCYVQQCVNDAARIHW